MQYKRSHIFIFWEIAITEAKVASTVKVTGIFTFPVQINIFFCSSGVFGEICGMRKIN